MEKVNFKKTSKPLYAPTAKDFVAVDVPKMTFVKINGEGDPFMTPAYKAAVEWLYSVAAA